MKRQDVLDIVTKHQEELHVLGVKSLALFGSTARDEASAASDVDLLVEFDRRITFFDFVEVQEFLEGILGTEKVDLVVRRAVIDELRDVIYGEAVPCFGNTGSSVSATS